MYEQATQTLLKYGVRSSQQRLVILDYLLEHPVHPAADAIHAALHGTFPTLSRTTVYNTLSRLAEAGAVRALDLDPYEQHFDADTTSHAHFFCTRCGAIHDLSTTAPLADLPKGARLQSAELTYKGICINCLTQ